MQAKPIQTVARIALGIMVLTVVFLLLNTRIGDAEGPVDDASSQAQHAHQQRLFLQQQKARLLDVERWVVLSTEEGALEDLFVESENPVLLEGALSVMVDKQQREWPAGYRRDFLSALSTEAIRSGVENQLPPSITLAQAVLESGWGRSGLAKKHNNLFGVKAGARDGGVLLASWEGGGEGRTLKKSRFRKYAAWSESLADHNRLLSRDRRYSQARESWTDWQQFLDRLAPVYATDPLYARRISQIVERYNLHVWDQLVAARVEKGAM